MTIVDKVTQALTGLVGPNAAHVLDSLIAFELTAGGVGLGSATARHFAATHPGLTVIFAVATPLLTALASKFRKAATAPPPDASK